MVYIGYINGMSQIHIKSSHSYTTLFIVAPSTLLDCFNLTSVHTAPKTLWEYIYIIGSCFGVSNFQKQWLSRQLQTFICTIFGMSHFILKKIVYYIKMILLPINVNCVHSNVTLLLVRHTATSYGKNYI